MKCVVWEIVGYKGNNDYDGSCDNNLNIRVVMDYRFLKKDVEEIFINQFSKKHRVVALRAKKVHEINI